MKTGRAGPTTLSHRMGFGALLALTMASSTFAFTAFSVLSGSLLGAATTLAMLAALGSAAVVPVLLAGHAPALLWIGAAALGASSGSWNSVGMFAIIDRMPSDTSGAASGVVMLGFLIGLGIGAPPFGWAVDVTGSYAPGLIAVAAVHLAGLCVARTLGEAPIVARSEAP